MKLRVLVLAVFLVSTLSSPIVTGQTKGRKKQVAKTQAPAAKPPVQDQGKQTQKGAIQAAALNSSNPEHGDSIPCEFSTADLLELRPSPEAATLSGEEAEATRVAAINAFNPRDASDSLTSAQQDLFVKFLTADDLTGLTPTEALNRVLTDLSKSNLFTPTEKPEDADLKVQKLTSGLLSFGSKSTPAFNGTVGSVNRSTLDNAGSVTSKFQTLADQKTSQPDTQAATAALDAITANTKQQSSRQTAIADAVRTKTAELLRPKDVNCSMEIYTYKGAESAFGPFVAKNYIAVQVTVRNLNPDQIFQVHDAEFAVDSDPSGRHARYFSGDDKRVVRSFSVAQQSFSSRNLWVNGAQAVGSLLSSIVPIFGGSYADAVGVLTGGAIPGLGKVWKDQSTDQLNLLNDLAFSPGVGGTTVPKLGVTVFVFFVPSKLFENGWWTLPCVDNVYLGSKLTNGRFLRAGSESGKSGLDVDRALEPCLAPKVGGTSESDQAPHANAAPNVPNASDTANSPQSTDTSQAAGVSQTTNQPDEVSAYQAAFTDDQSQGDKVDLFARVKTLPYKKWSGNKLEIFRELSLVTISGAHSVDTSALTPSANLVTCPPKDADGNTVFDGSDPIVCNVSGQNLGTIDKLRLRNSEGVPAVVES